MIGLLLLLIVGIVAVTGYRSVKRVRAERRERQDMARRILPRGAIVVYNPNDRALSREAGGDPCAVWKVDFHPPRNPLATAREHYRIVNMRWHAGYASTAEKLAAYAELRALRGDILAPYRSKGSSMRYIYVSKPGGKPLSIGINKAKRVARSADRRDRLLVLQHLGSMPKLKQDSRHQQLVRSRHHYYHEQHEEFLREQSRVA